MLSPAHLAPHPYTSCSPTYVVQPQPKDYYLALPLPPVPTTAPLTIRRQRSTPNLVVNLSAKAPTEAPLLSPLSRAPSSASTASTATASTSSHCQASSFSSSLKPPSSTPSPFSCLSLSPFADPHTTGEAKRRPNKLRKARSAVALKSAAVVELAPMPAIAPSAAERMRAERRRREATPVRMGLGGLVEARPWAEEVEDRLGQVVGRRQPE